MTRAKYFGRIDEGQVDLMSENRLASHALGLARRGRSSVCLEKEQVSQGFMRQNVKTYF